MTQLNKTINESEAAEMLKFTVPELRMAVWTSNYGRAIDDQVVRVVEINNERQYRLIDIKLLKLCSEMAKLTRLRAQTFN